MTNVALRDEQRLNVKQIPVQAMLKPGSRRMSTGILSLMILLALPASGAEKAGYSTLVMRIPSHARVSVPAVLADNDLASNSVSGPTANASVQLSIRPDKSSAREIVMAEWRPAPDSPDVPCSKPILAESAPLGSFHHNLSAIVQEPAPRLAVRARWSHREAEAVQVASLNLASMAGVLNNSASSRRSAPISGAWLAPQRTMPIASAVPLASVPAAPVSDFGLELEFSSPQAPMAVGHPGVVTFTVTVL